MEEPVFSGTEMRESEYQLRSQLIFAFVNRPLVPVIRRCVLALLQPRFKPEPARIAPLLRSTADRAARAPLRPLLLRAAAGDGRNALDPELGQRRAGGTGRAARRTRRRTRRRGYDDPDDLNALTGPRAHVGA